MKLHSVNVALPREVEINGRLVATGIYKETVAGPVWLGRLTLAGDGQADLTVHGGEHQAAYSYPVEHYAHWEQVMGTGPFAHGQFGENFTLSGGTETEVCIGDVWQIGETARVQVTMPRLPCFKFGHKMGRPQILKEFLHSGFSGYYHRVLQEGAVAAGDDIRLLERDPRGITVRQMLGIQRLGEGDAAGVERALEIECLPPSLREELEKRLGTLSK
jgi:MOSC domain-containing protein YiiM